MSLLASFTGLYDIDKSIFQLYFELSRCNDLKSDYARSFDMNKLLNCYHENPSPSISYDEILLCNDTVIGSGYTNHSAESICQFDAAEHFKLFLHNRRSEKMKLQDLSVAIRRDAVSCFDVIMREMRGSTTRGFIEKDIFEQILKYKSHKILRSYINMFNLFVIANDKHTNSIFNTGDISMICVYSDWLLENLRKINNASVFPGIVFLTSLERCILNERIKIMRHLIDRNTPHIPGIIGSFIFADKGDTCDLILLHEYNNLINHPDCAQLLKELYN